MKNQLFLLDGGLYSEENSRAGMLPRYVKLSDLDTDEIKNRFGTRYMTDLKDLVPDFPKLRDGKLVSWRGTIKDALSLASTAFIDGSVPSDSLMNILIFEDSKTQEIYINVPKQEIRGHKSVIIDDEGLREKLNNDYLIGRFVVAGIDYPEQEVYFDTEIEMPTHQILLFSGFGNKPVFNFKNLQSSVFISGIPKKDSLILTDTEDIIEYFEIPLKKIQKPDVNQLIDSGFSIDDLAETSDKPEVLDAAFKLDDKTDSDAYLTQIRNIVITNEITEVTENEPEKDIKDEEDIKESGAHEQEILPDEEPEIGFNEQDNTTAKIIDGPDVEPDEIVHEEQKEGTLSDYLSKHKEQSEDSIDVFGQIPKKEVDSTKPKEANHTELSIPDAPDDFNDLFGINSSEQSDIPASALKEAEPAENDYVTGLSDEDDTALSNFFKTND